MCACCGRACEVKIDGGDAFEGYISQISAEGQRIDVTAFGDDEYGSWLTDCTVTGSFMIQSYNDPGVSIGDNSALTANVCGHAYSCNAACQTKVVDFDAKAVPYWTMTWAVEETITGF